MTDVRASKADATTIRWIADIQEDGSRLMNLSGRAAHLGDGLSRQDEAHQRILRNAAHMLSTATVEDFLDDAETDGPQPATIGSQTFPFPEKDRTSVHTKAPPRTPVRSVDPNDFAAAEKQRENRIRLLRADAQREERVPAKARPPASVHTARKAGSAAATKASPPRASPSLASC